MCIPQYDELDGGYAMTSFSRLIDDWFLSFYCFPKKRGKFKIFIPCKIQKFSPQHATATLPSRAAPPPPTPMAQQGALASAVDEYLRHAHSSAPPRYEDIDGKQLKIGSLRWVSARNALAFSALQRAVLQRRHANNAAVRMPRGPPPLLPPQVRDAARRWVAERVSTGTYTSRSHVINFISAHSRAAGKPLSISPTIASRLMSEWGYTIQRVIPTPLDRFRSSLIAEVKHFKFNLNHFPLRKLWVVDETNLRLSLTPTRAYAQRGAGGARLAVPNNVRGPGFTLVLAVRGDGGDTASMFIPHHTAPRRKRKSANRSRAPAFVCFVRKKYGLCSCQRAPVRGMSGAHWGHYLQKILGKKVMRGSALIMDQLQCHTTPANRRVIAKKGVFLLYMYPKSAAECSPLDGGYFALFEAHVKTALSGIPVAERNQEALLRIITQVISETLPNVPNFFMKVGYEDARELQIAPRPRCDGSLLLPFGRIPAGARLSEVQRRYLADKTKGRGRPRNTAAN